MPTDLSRESFYAALESRFGPRPWSPPTHPDGSTCDGSPRESALMDVEFAFSLSDPAGTTWALVPKERLTALLDGTIPWTASCRDALPPIAGGSDAPVREPSLLDALLRLEQHAEGRRVARKALREATHRLARHLTEQLRVDDAVTVAGRTYAVCGWRSNVGEYERLAVVEDWGARAIDSGREYLHGDFQCRMSYASDEDLRHFAKHAREIVAAFADKLKADREQMTAAAEQARTQRV